MSHKTIRLRCHRALPPRTYDQVIKDGVIDMADVETHPEEPLPLVRLPLATPARSPSE